MPNIPVSGSFKEYITISSAPSGTDLGDWTNEVCLRDLRKTEKIDRMYFSVREAESDSSQASDTSVMTITLQFKCDGDAGWQDYNYNDETAFKAGDRIIIEDTAAGVRWRAGVKDGGYTSGSLVMGFDW